MKYRCPMGGWRGGTLIVCKTSFGNIFEKLLNKSM
jgi:hypothetical protein